MELLMNEDGAQKNRTEVTLNVYDLENSARPEWIKNLNWYLYSLGLGLYHSAVEVNGREFAFGGHDEPVTGVFENPPRQAVGATFREAIPMGYTTYTPEEVESVVAELSIEYTGISYNLFTRNCNNFSEDLAFKLSGSRAPLWINRLASYGETLKPLLPAGMDAPHLAPVQAEPQQSLMSSQQQSLRSAHQQESLSTPVQDAQFLRESVPIDRDVQGRR